MDILIVDDDPAVCQMLNVVLGTSGDTLRICTGDERTWQEIEAARPDLVLLDLMMPGVDTWAVLESMRQLPKPPAVIVVSAYADQPEVKKRAIDAGAVAVLSKPFRVAELAAACEKVRQTLG